MMMKTRPLVAALVVGAAIGCSDTTAPLPDPEEVLLVVNSTANTLSIVPVDDPNSAVQVPLGGTTPTPVSLSAREGIALVPLGLDNAVAVVDLRTAAVVRTVPLPDNSGATGSAIVDDSIGYVGNPNLNTVSRVNYTTGATSEVPVGAFPQGLVFTRGKVFVLNGNLDDTFSPAGSSWITVVDPFTNARAAGIDSIPLTGDGNAGFADVGSDGLLYVMSTGSYFSGEGRLSVVDPLSRTEIASFAGLGTGPGNVAADPDGRLFVSSFTEGVMEFNLDSNKVVRGAGQGITFASGNSTVAVDSKDRIYGIESGACAGGQPGIAHVLDATLEQTGTIQLGECPSGSVVVQIPPEGAPDSP
jgi:hypothetical protein